jgi:ribonuclease HII
MKSQIKKIAGVDEVGRGAWAGPLVAAAVILNEEFDLELKDSKKLNFAQRQWLAQEIKQSSYWAVGLSSQYEIDKLVYKGLIFWQRNEQLIIYQPDPRK